MNQGVRHVRRVELLEVPLDHRNVHLKNNHEVPRIFCGHVSDIAEAIRLEDVVKVFQGTLLHRDFTSSFFNIEMRVKTPRQISSVHSPIAATASARADTMLSTTLPNEAVRRRMIRLCQVVALREADVILHGSCAGLAKAQSTILQERAHRDLAKMPAMCSN